MKVLHITFRYGRDVYGGAELHMRKLSEELVKKGIEVDVCTTKSHGLEQIIKSSVRWDNRLEDEIINGVNVLRFPVKNHNKYYSFVSEKILQHLLDNEEDLSDAEVTVTSEDVLNSPGCVLLNGWNNLERYGSESMRWTRKNATFILRDSNVRSISLQVLNPKNIQGNFYVNAGEFNKLVTIPGGASKSIVSVPLPGLSGKIKCCIRLDKSWSPLKDIRTLGIAVSNIRYETDQDAIDVDLEYDYRKLFTRNRAYVQYMIRRASTRNPCYCNLFDYLRGPDSPAMIKWLKANCRKYDVVMASMFPFNTIKYALAARTAGVPVVAMPLMHADDEFYHWPHYYNYLREANHVFALSDYSKSEMFSLLGAESTVIGAGIDSSIFLSKVGDGLSFRKKYRLGEKRIVLTVSRKSQSKRYEQIIKAVEKVNEYSGLGEVLLVMIGPDEDKLPVSSQYATYLGKVTDDELMAAYDACDIFVMMSESESFGMVFCEAWSHGKPVIGNSLCGPVSSIISDGVDGYLCDDHQNLADRIVQLLNDSMLRDRMGKNGYNKVINNYTWDRVANNVYNCYKKLI